MVKSPELRLWEAITQGMTPEEKKTAAAKTRRFVFTLKQQRKELRRIHREA